MSLLEKQHSKKVPALRHKKFNYSNLRIIDLVTKIIYPFVIISSFNGNTSGLTLSVFGLFVFNELIFWIMFPFEFREEYSQIILLVLGQIITIILLFMYGLGILNEIATYILILSLIVLGLISLIL